MKKSTTKRVIALGMTTILAAGLGAGAAQASSDPSQDTIVRAHVFPKMNADGIIERFVYVDGGTIEQVIPGSSIADSQSERKHFITLTLAEKDVFVEMLPLLTTTGYASSPYVSTSVTYEADPTNTTYGQVSFNERAGARLGPINVLDEAVVANEDRVTVEAGKTTAIDILGNDYTKEGFDAATDVRIGKVMNGTATYDRAEGVLNYTPEEGFTGATYVEYSLTAPEGYKTYAHARITVQEAKSVEDGSEEVVVHEPQEDIAPSDEVEAQEPLTEERVTTEEEVTEEVAPEVVVEEEPEDAPTAPAVVEDAADLDSAEDGTPSAEEKPSGHKEDGVGTVEVSSTSPAPVVVTEGDSATKTDTPASPRDYIGSATDEGGDAPVVEESDAYEVAVDEATPAEVSASGEPVSKTRDVASQEDSLAITGAELAPAGIVATVLAGLGAMFVAFTRKHAPTPAKVGRHRA